MPVSLYVRHGGRTLQHSGLLAFLAGVVAWCSPVAAGQTFSPATASAPAGELPADVLAVLGGSEDFTYDFDEPGYYALLEFVQRSALAPGHEQPPIVVDDWRVLFERPADFRGRPITIEGVVGRNKDPYTHPRFPRLGQVWQVELRRPEQAASCTVVFTTDVSHVPLGATIRVTGYFVKVNRYPRQAGEPGLAALLVAPGPTAVVQAAPPAATQGLDWRWMTAAIVVGLVAALFLLRRARQSPRHDPHSLHARRQAPLSLADDLAEWAQRDDPGREDQNAE